MADRERGDAVTRVETVSLSVLLGRIRPLLLVVDARRAILSDGDVDYAQKVGRC